MPLTEQRAIGAGCDEERLIKRQSRAGKVVQRAIDIRHLSAIEHVETFGQQLEFCSFGNSEASRNTHVEVPDVRLLEEVPWHERETVCTTRSVGPTSGRRT